MAGAHDVFLRSVPSDANPHDVRLYDPTVPDSPPGADDFIQPQFALRLARQPRALRLPWQPDDAAAAAADDFIQNLSWILPRRVPARPPMLSFQPTPDDFLSPLLRLEQRIKRIKLFASYVPEADNFVQAARLVSPRKAPVKAHSHQQPDESDDLPSSSSLGFDGRVYAKTIGTLWQPYTEIEAPPIVEPSPRPPSVGGARSPLLKAERRLRRVVELHGVVTLPSLGAQGALGAVTTVNAHARLPALAAAGAVAAGPVVAIVVHMPTLEIGARAVHAPVTAAALAAADMLADDVMEAIEAIEAIEALPEDQK